MAAFSKQERVIQIDWGERRRTRKQSSAPRPLLNLLLSSLCWQEEARQKAEEARKKAEEVRSTTHKGTVDNLPITLTLMRQLRQCLCGTILAQRLG